MVSLRTAGEILGWEKVGVLVGGINGTPDGELQRRGGELTKRRMKK